jgi:VCBS repeat protein
LRPRQRAVEAALLLAGALLAGCTRLPKIDGGDCGNGVVEPPEDCDTFGVESGALCRPRGSVGECHLDCSSTSQGRSGCPDGWGCDLGGICRRPTGELAAAGEFEVGTALSLASADFDGDGRSDLLSAEVGDPFGVTRIKFHYFDELGGLSETRPFPPLLVAPSVSQMSSDERGDVVFSDGRVGVLLGRPDRSWVPETFSSYRIPGTAIRTLTVSDLEIQQASGFIVLAALDGLSGVYIPDPTNNGVPRLLGALPSAVEDLIGDPVSGALIDGTPCRQAIVAVGGESRFFMLDVCTLDQSGAVTYRPELVSLEVALDPPEPIAFAPRIADIDGDGHLDVIVASARQAYVAYGDGQTLATAVPYQSGITDPEVLAIGSGPMPLAAGDVTGDGVVDLVMPDYVALSAPSPTTPGQSDYGFAGGAGPWTVGALADLNANGHPDIIVGSSGHSGLDFFNGTDTGFVNYFAIPTTRPVQRLVTGDYDGDLVEDVAFTQSVANAPDQSAVMISFGVPFGPPLPPVAVARLSNIEEMETYREGTLSHLLLTSSEGDGPERRGVLTLLAGSGDRVPTALYELTTFAEDSSVAESRAARVLAGSFLGTARDDVLALAFVDDPANDGVQFWLLPAITSSAGTPVLLAGTLPPEMRPVYFGGVAADTPEGLSLASVATDLDRDDRTEAILSMPALDDEHCALLVYEVEADHVVLRSQATVAEPCAHVELLPADVDGDGYTDILSLTARADGSERRLSVYWSDGLGGLSSELRSIIADPAAEPQAVTILPPAPALPPRAGLIVPPSPGGPSVVYATPSGIERVAIGAERALSPAESLVSLDGCTGLTAADLNGDGAIDLAAAVRGDLRIFKAALEGL